MGIGRGSHGAFSTFFFRYKINGPNLKQIISYFLPSLVMQMLFPMFLIVYVMSLVRVRSLERSSSSFLLLYTIQIYYISEDLNTQYISLTTLTAHYLTIVFVFI